MIKLLEKRPILTIISLVALLIFPILDILEVSIMEARNFISAREMLVDSNWVLTTMSGEARYQKPPLPTWLTAISASVFGLKNIWGLRLPAALMVMLLGSMVFTLSRKLKLSKNQSLGNGLIAVTSLYVVLIIFEAPWDIYAHAFMLTGIYFLVKILNAERNSILNTICASLFIGCSILSKGPVALYVLLLPFILSYIAIYRKNASSKTWSLSILSIVLGLFIGFSWYLYVRYADPATFSRMAENETGNWTSYNVRPFYYYWSFFVQSGVWTLPAFISLIYPYLKSRVSDLKAYQFTWLWTILAVVLLSIIPEKKSRYLMPILIPLAINCGFYVDYLMRKFNGLRDRKETIPVYFNFGLLGTVFLLLSVAGIVSPFILEGVSWWLLPLSIILIFISVILLRSLIKKNFEYVFMFSLCALIISLFCFTQVQKFEIPWQETSINNNSSNTVATFEAFESKEKLPIYIFDVKSPEMIWASGRILPQIYDDKAVLLPPEDKFYLLVFEIEFSEVSKTLQGYETEYQFTIDLNKVPKTSRNYTGRKRAEVFKVEKLDR
ncbi:phospholipid carrier-dependent glycosyltransferase [Dokdonia sinensis]|uniref:Phospholipid carrier-dependent glycosyltransferase n=1 Tax=Dokdonia sinensis TaxID=2479847 RepID=A0A3M0G819_9FLAO|nr:phospholipid carrier-dependent glycosyltransferase [Dokdonia sinensis]RMB58552.1 phospholipid carrier-dependent glycosyltransferase [Dokdonia sinensis]